MAAGAGRGIDPVAAKEAFLLVRVGDIGPDVAEVDGEIGHDTVESIHEHRFGEHRQVP